MSEPRSSPPSADLHTPDVELTIDAPLVRRLLREQHPDLAEQPIESFGSGWDNAMFRVGANLCARLPRRRAAAQLILHEQRWLPILADRLPLATPVPIRIGESNKEYPWHWSITSWIAGTTANQTELRADQGLVLANFLKSLHVVAPEAAPRNLYRGVALAERRAAIEMRMARLERVTSSITSRIRSLWECALEAESETAHTWIHGDLHARNVLVDEGRLCAVIDWGDLCRGDPATDLASLWTIVSDPSSRREAIEFYDASPATWQRARGWAILFGIVLLDTGLVDHPIHAAMGARTLQNLDTL